MYIGIGILVCSAACQHGGEAMGPRRGAARRPHQDTSQGEQIRRCMTWWRLRRRKSTDVTSMWFVLVVRVPPQTLEELRMKCGMRLCPPPTVHESCRVQARPSPDPLPGLHPILFTAEEELQHHKRGSFAVSTGSTR